MLISNYVYGFIWPKVRQLDCPSAKTN